MSTGPIHWHPSLFFDDLDTFFAERRLRRGKDGSWLEDSYDYGVQWRDQDGRQYRLTWIGTTHREEGDGGELYLVRLTDGFVALSEHATVIFGGDDRGIVEWLCTVPPAPPDPRSITSATDGNVERLLEGWAEACGPRGSIDWIRQTVAKAIENGEAVAPSDS